MKPIQTKRLHLIPLTVKNLEQCLDDFQKLEVALGLESSDFRLGEPVKRAIEMKLQKMSADPGKDEWYTYWLVVLKSENRGIGLVGFKGAPDDAGEIEIGYGLQGAYQHRGYMTEAAEGLVEWAFEQIPDLTVVAETNKSNLSSQRVLQRLGFEPYKETEMTVWWQRKDHAQ